MKALLSLIAATTISTTIFSMNFLKTEAVILKLNHKVEISDEVRHFLQSKTVTLHKLPYPIATALIDIKNKKRDPATPRKHVRSTAQLHFTAARIKQHDQEMPLYFDRFTEENNNNRYKNPLYSSQYITMKILRLVAWNHPRITITCTLLEFIKILNNIPPAFQEKIVKSSRLNQCCFESQKIRHTNNTYCCSFDKVTDYINFIVRMDRKKRTKTKQRHSV